MCTSLKFPMKYCILYFLEEDLTAPNAKKIFFLTI